MDNKGINWKQFLVTLLGTSIGVALTFTLNGMRESHRKERAQRLTAVMIIHDIDNTVKTLERIKKQEELQSTKALLWRDQPDSLMKAPYDSVDAVLSWLFNDGQEYHFDDSKERIFHSSQDSWQNLGSVKFIDNVQSFFHDRQQLQDYMNKDELFAYPVSQKEFREYSFEQYSIQKKINSLDDMDQMVRTYLKEKLSDRQVLFFLDASSSRLSFYEQHIDAWTRLNDENKFLIGITDQEMDAYINSITQTGVAVKADKLRGTWKIAQAQNNTSTYYEFEKDSVFTMKRIRSYRWNAKYGSGLYKERVKISGIWKLKGDSLTVVQNPQTADIEVDVSEMVPVEGKKDSLEALAKQYRDETLRKWQEVDEESLRTTLKVRMDASYDKIEWTSKNGNVFYTVRMK